MNSELESLLPSKDFAYDWEDKSDDGKEPIEISFDQEKPVVN